MGTLRMPTDVEDREVLLHDFRNETLAFGELPIAARVVDTRLRVIGSRTKRWRS